MAGSDEIVEERVKPGDERNSCARLNCTNGGMFATIHDQTLQMLFAGWIGCWFAARQANTEASVFLPNRSVYDQKLIVFVPRRLSHIRRATIECSPDIGLNSWGPR